MLLVTAVCMTVGSLTVGAASASGYAGVWTLGASGAPTNGGYSMAADAAGNLYVSNLYPPDGSYNNAVQAFEDPAGNTSGAFTPLGGALSDTSISASAGASQIAADAAGDLAVTWVLNGDAYVATRPAGGSWSPSIDLGLAITPSVAMDAAGNATVAWTTVDNPDYISARVRPVGSDFSAAAWSDPQTLYTADGAQVPQAIAAVTKGDAVYVIVEGQGSQETQIVGVTWPVTGSTPAAPTTISTVGSKSGYPSCVSAAIACSVPVIAADGKGDVTAAWIAIDNSGSGADPTNGDSSLIYASESGDSWTSGKVLVSGSDPAHSPNVVGSVAMNPTGATAIAWNRGTGSGTYGLAAAIRPSLGGSFGSPISLVDVANPSDSGWYSQIGLDAAGDAVVTWEPTLVNPYLEGGVIRAGGKTIAGLATVTNSVASTYQLLVLPDGDAAVLTDDGALEAFGFDALPSTRLVAKLSPGKVVDAGTAAVSATLSSAGHSLAGQSLTLLAKPSGAKAYHSAGSAKTGSGGTASIKIPHASQTTRYEWRFAGTTSYAGSTSAAVTLSVAQKVSLSVHLAGKKLTATGVIAPAKQGVTVTLWSVNGHLKKRLGAGKTTRAGKFTIAARLGPGHYKVVATVLADATNAAGTSAVRTVAVA
jgi:hypothetical protein